MSGKPEDNPQSPVQRYTLAEMFQIRHGMRERGELPPDGAAAPTITVHDGAGGQPVTMQFVNREWVEVTGDVPKAPTDSCE